MVRKLYTDKELFEKTCEANEQGKKLVKVQEEIDVSFEVYEYEKKRGKYPIYDENGKPTGEYKECEVDDLDKPIMIEEIDPETGETIKVLKHHTETRKELVEKLQIQDNPKNFERCFFNTSLGYIRRKPFVQGTGEYKDFLSDIVTGLKVGDTILTYNENLEQQIKTVTQEFIDECVIQYNKDFYGE
jgi:hypothetical protein